MKENKYLIRIETSMKIDINLYRSGNSISPRLHNIRDKDVVKYKDPTTGLTKVKGMSGGISTFTAPKPDRNWYWIRAGTKVPPKLVVTRDRTDSITQITHYTIRPADDMLLTEFIAQMQKITNVSKLPIEKAIMLGGRWEKIG